MPEAELSDRHCAPCRGGTPPLAGEQLRRFQNQLPGWQVADERQLVKSFAFPDFKSALSFVDRIGAVAEQEGHHPDLYLTWGRVDVRLWTHAIDGLSESDFILAAKIDRLLAP